MTNQLASVRLNDGEYKIIRDNSDKYNPYRIYHIFYQFSPDYGCATKRKHLVAKYADMTACLYHLYLKSVK